VRIPLTLFLILIWTFLILAPINAFAENEAFTCKPVVAGMPKKGGDFYVEDIHDESTPILDIIPDNQFFLRGEDKMYILKTIPLESLRCWFLMKAYQI